eukprot:1772767-Karenia_brevis.AAC.1
MAPKPFQNRSQIDETSMKNRCPMSPTWGWGPQAMISGLGGLLGGSWVLLEPKMVSRADFT